MCARVPLPQVLRPSNKVDHVSDIMRSRQQPALPQPLYAAPVQRFVVPDHDYSVDDGGQAY